MQNQNNNKAKETKNPPSKQDQAKKEYGGPKGLEPTRYGDWEVKGRASDF